MRPVGSIALTGALVLVQTPVLAEGGAEALSVMSVSLSDVVGLTLDLGANGGRHTEPGRCWRLSASRGWREQRSVS